MFNSLWPTNFLVRLLSCVLSHDHATQQHPRLNQTEYFQYWGHGWCELSPAVSYIWESFGQFLWQFSQFMCGISLRYYQACSLKSMYMRKRILNAICDFFYFLFFIFKTESQWRNAGDQRCRVHPDSFDILAGNLQRLFGDFTPHASWGLSLSLTGTPYVTNISVAMRYDTLWYMDRQSSILLHLSE